MIRPALSSDTIREAAARPASTSLWDVVARSFPNGPSMIAAQVATMKTEPKHREDTGKLRQQAVHAQIAARKAAARAARIARLLNAPFDTRVAYFNMLGCYHTDPDEPNYGNLARHFATCGSRMPRQYDWLTGQGITIAGVGEFQGKAWGVLAAYNRSHDAWDIYPRGQSGPNGQNPVVWRTSTWRLVSGEQLAIPYNCANGGSCRATSTLVLLEEIKRHRRLYVLNTHHTSDGGGGGAARRGQALSVELGRIAAAKATGVPIIYMGDFNSIGAAIGRISGSLHSAFSGGMLIDQIWGSQQLTFSDTHYDSSFRSLGLTDHGTGIAVTTVRLPRR